MLLECNLNIFCISTYSCSLEKLPNGYGQKFLAYCKTSSFLSQFCPQYSKDIEENYVNILNKNTNKISLTRTHVPQIASRAAILLVHWNLKEFMDYETLFLAPNVQTGIVCHLQAHSR